MTTPIDPVPTVTCASCGRVAQCWWTKDGTLYRPFTWAFVDASAFVGVCNFCQVTLPRFGLPNLDAFTVEAPPLASSAALAFRDHDVTLRALAEQEQEDAALDVARLYEQHLRARLQLEEALRIGATTEAKALTIHEARLDSTRTHNAWELAEHDLLGAAKYGDAWAERRELLRRHRVGPFASRFAHEPPPSPVIPPAYGSADVAPTNATFAPDFNDPGAIRIRRDLEPICDGDATLYEYGGPFDCPGCSACVPLDGKVDT
jgi:hypothetical protein